MREDTLIWRQSSLISFLSVDFLKNLISMEIRISSHEKYYESRDEGINFAINERKNYRRNRRIDERQCVKRVTTMDVLLSILLFTL